jgi:hypothetical protein
MARTSEEGKMNDRRTLEHWLAMLTREGYDPVETRAHTNRGDWNSNYPMNHLNMLFRREGGPDVVLSSYSCNGAVSRSSYATISWPTRSGSKHWFGGFLVRGSDATTRATRSVTIAREWLALKKAPKVDHDELERRTEAEVA